MSQEEANPLSICEQLTRPPEEFVNDGEIESAWMGGTIRHMEAYYRLIKTIDNHSDIRLSKDDTLIYDTFVETFPELDCENLTEESLKNPEAKTKWREFITKFQDIVDDYNFGTMLRLKSHGGYTQENSIIVVRLQFVAIEIVRNRKGLNTDLPEIDF